MKPKFKPWQVVAWDDSKPRIRNRFVQIAFVADKHPTLGWRYEIFGDSKYVHAESCFRALSKKEAGR